MKEIERRGLAGYANDTRWQKFLGSIVPLDMDCRVKWIFGGPSRWNRWLLPADGYFENVSAGPIVFREIEWLELDPATQRTHDRPDEVDNVAAAAALMEAVESARLVASDAGDGRVRVWGYR